MRKVFIPWINQRYQLISQDAEDLFHLVYTIFIDNIFKGKLKTLSSSLKSYFFAIGKNKYPEIQRRKIRIREAIDEFLSGMDNWEDPVQEELEFEVMESALDALGEPCRELLTLYYYQNLSARLISQQMAYKNESTVRNQKYKCLKRLQQIFHRLRRQEV
ncbi:RNA polymerase sigma factor [Flavilitoribacter nigricans]|nr:sigma-70 family RNA polymerase sigma factor [Flavilitoribacter nigricans]